VDLSASFSIYAYGVGAAYSRLLRSKTGAGIPLPSNILMPDVTAAMPETPDNNTLVFKLRPDVKFHNIAPVNGRGLTADDVKYSFQRRGMQGSVNAPLVANIDKLEVVDPLTLRITLKKPDADALFSIAEGHNKLLAHEAVELHGDIKNGPTIGTGPWMFKSEDESSTTLVKNPTYFEQGLPAPDSVAFLRTPDYTAQASAFLAGQLEYRWAFVTLQQAQQAASAIPGVNRKDVIGLGGSEFLLQAGSGPTADVRVRQALDLAIDRDGLGKTLYPGLQYQPAQPLAALPGADWNLSVDELKQLHPRDLTKAKQLLAAAGQANGFSIDTLVPNTGGSVFQSQAEFIAANLAEIGVKMNIKIVDSTQHIDAVNSSGNFQSTFGTAFTQSSLNGELTARFLPNAARNTFHLDDPMLVDLINKQFSLFDTAQRQAVIKDIIRRIFYDALPIVTVGGTTIHLWQPYLKNMNVPGNAGETHYFAEVSIDKS
jgi:peptide/nickel transport system substrate-binding protein